MKDSIYIPVMIISSIFRVFFVHLANAIEKFDTPEGIKILQVYDSSDRIMEDIFTQVENMNKDRITSPYFRNEPYSMLKIEFETDKDIRYQILPWLDKQLKDVVRNYHDTVGLYFFYLLDGGEYFHCSNIAKMFNDEGTSLLEDDRSDDFSALNEAAPFLNCIFYNMESLEYLFPTELAKYLLLFG